MEKAYKGMMGGYNVWKDGDDKHDPTHIVLPYEEYQNLQRKVKNAINKADNAVKMQHQAEDKAREDIRQIEEEAKEKIAAEREALADELARAKRDKESAERLNTGLLNIMKNRANAKRGIKPKKQHDGYVVLRSEQYEYSHQRDRKSRETLTLWRTTLQTPVDIGIAANEAQKVIGDAMAHKIGAKLGFQKASFQGGSLSDNIKAVDGEDWGTAVYLLDVKYRQNAKTRLWEVTYIHNKAIKIPEDMYAG